MRLNVGQGQGCLGSAIHCMLQPIGHRCIRLPDPYAGGLLSWQVQAADSASYIFAARSSAGAQRVEMLRVWLHFDGLCTVDPGICTLSWPLGLSSGCISEVPWMNGSIFTWAVDRLPVSARRQKPKP